MADDVDFSLGTPPFRIVDPERIPARRYYDEAFYALECERLWPRTWQMACRLEQIPKVGDWTEYSNLGKSVIVIRTRDGVKAYHNACRHRGVQLVQGHGHCEAQGFSCPFHGWRWNLDGRNTFVYGRRLFDDAQLDEADLALRPCRLETWGGWAFVNFDDDAPSFRETIGPLTGRLDQYQVEKLRTEWWYATVLPANWKIAMEAFMEGYHVMRTHPQLQAANPGLIMAMYGQDTGGSGKPFNPRATVQETIQAQFRQMELLSEGMAGMCHAKDIETARGLLDVELPKDPAQAIGAWYRRVKAEVHLQGRARGEPTPDLLALAATHPIKSVEFLFPNFFLLPYLSSFAAYRIRPLGPESCRFEMWSLTLFPEGVEPEIPLEPTELAYDSDQFPAIPRQDYGNIPLQQLGLHAAGFDFMRLSRTIEGLISNYQQIIDGYLGGAPDERLAKAIHELGGGFDGPVKDLSILG